MYRTHEDIKTTQGKINKFWDKKYNTFKKTIIPNFENDAEAEKMRQLDEKINRLLKNKSDDKKKLFRRKIVLKLYDYFKGKNSEKDIKQLVTILNKNGLIEYYDFTIAMDFITSILHNCLQQISDINSIENLDLNDAKIFDQIKNCIEQMKEQRALRHFRRGEREWIMRLEEDKKHGKTSIELDNDAGLNFGNQQLFGGKRRKRTHKRKKKSKKTRRKR